MDVNFQSKSPGLPKKTPLFIIPKLGFDICYHIFNYNTEKELQRYL